VAGDLEALGWLKSPGLIEAIAADVAALGVVGEADNALLVYLALTSRLADRPLSVMVQSASGAGKSTLADTIAGLMPPQACLAYSALTGQALYYLADGEDSLAHKVLVVAEDHGATAAAYPLRLLVSAGRLRIASAASHAGRVATRSYEVAGPVAVLMTTTAAQVDDELASRLLTVTVGESIEQTRAIHAAQRAGYTPTGLSAATRKAAIVARHHAAQRLLEPLPIVIPDVEQLGFADVTVRSRRDHDKYLSLIAASALLHQHQRTRGQLDAPCGAVEYLQAAAEDVALADRLAAGVLVRDPTDLPPATASLLSRLGSWAGTGRFTRRAARESLGLGDTQLKVHLARLVELEYLTTTRLHGTSSYQLAWDPPRHTTRTTADGRSGRSGSGRGPVGRWSAPNRPPTAEPSAQVNGHKPASDSVESGGRARIERRDSPYDRAGQPARSPT